MGVRQPAAGSTGAQDILSERRVRSGRRGRADLAEPGARSNGQAQELHPQDIDTLIRIAGQGGEPETIMYLTLHADTAGGIVQTNAARAGPSRGATSASLAVDGQSLSPTGLDLTNDEYLEFWVFQPSKQPADSRPACS